MVSEAAPADSRHEITGRPPPLCGDCSIAPLVVLTQHDGDDPDSLDTNGWNAMSMPRLLPNDWRYRTTYRCVRLECALTARLLDPIERCPRCGAAMAVIERPQLDLDEFVASATAEVVAGFSALLGFRPTF